MGNKLRIIRERTLGYSARSVSVLIDDRMIGKLTNGNALSLSLPTGYHTLEIKMGSRTIGIQQLVITEYTDVTARFILNGHGDAVINVTQVTTEQPPANAWIPQQTMSQGDIYATKSKNNNSFAWIVCIIIILILIWIFLPNSIGIIFKLTPA